MPAIALPAAALPDGLAAVIDVPAMPLPASGGSAAGNDGFQALLDVAGTQPNVASANQQQENNSPAPKPATIANTQPAPVSPAAPVSHAPAKIPPAGQHANNNASSAADSNVGHNGANNANQTKNTATANDDNTSQRAAPQSPSDTSPQLASAQNAPVTAQDNSQPPVDSQPVVLSAGKLRDELRQQLDAISQILMSILQAMNGVAALPAATPVMPQPATDASGSDQVAGTSQSALSPTDAISLLKDMQSLINQLQQALQQDGQATDIQINGSQIADMAAPLSGIAQPQDQAPQGQAPETATGSGATLQQLIDALQTDNATLAQMLKPQNTGNTVSDVPALSLLNASSSTQVDHTALLNSIAQVRGQLQQLQAANDAFFQQEQADFQAQFAQSLSSLAQTPNAGGQSSNTAAAISNVSSSDNSSNAAVTATQSMPQTAINIAGAMAVAPAAASQGNTGGGTSDNGDSQGQPAPLQAVTASNQPAPAGNVTTVSFARVLNQAAAPASLLDQVTFNVKTAVADGSSKIHIQLEPADLGKLDIQLNVGADGKTGVIITADNKNTLALLQRDTTGLMRALSDAGLSTSSGNLSFSLGGGQQQQFAGGQQPASQAAAIYNSTQPPEDDATVPIISQTYVVSVLQGLDITI